MSCAQTFLVWTDPIFTQEYYHFQWVLIPKVITPLCENRVLPYEIKAYRMFGKECLRQLQKLEGIGSDP